MPRAASIRRVHWPSPTDLLSTCEVAQFTINFPRSACRIEYRLSDVMGSTAVAGLTLHNRLATIALPITDHLLLFMLNSLFLVTAIETRVGNATSRHADPVGAAPSVPGSPGRSRHSHYPRGA